MNDVGEQTIATPEAQALMSDLEEILKIQLEKLKQQ